MKRSTMQFALLIACFMIPCLLHAQPGFPDGTDDVPLDGGLSLLVAAGAGYVARKMRSKKKINLHF